MIIDQFMVLDILSCSQIQHYVLKTLSSRQPCLQIAELAVRSIGGTPMRFVSAGGLDANWLTARGIPTVTLGCGQLFQHTCSEQLDLSWFHQACRIAMRIATSQEQ